MTLDELLNERYDPDKEMRYDFEQLADIFAKTGRAAEHFSEQDKVICDALIGTSKTILYLYGQVRERTATEEELVDLLGNYMAGTVNLIAFLRYHLKLDAETLTEKYRQVMERGEEQ